jgi:hypothetical protein
VIYFIRDGSVSGPFSSVSAAEIMSSLAEKFKMRFNDFCSHAGNTHISEKPFSIEVIDASEKLQLEVNELQYDSILHSTFNQEALIIFYAFYQYLSTKFCKCI